MAKLEKRGLSLEINNIKALYCKDDDINLENYTYEAFNITFKINNQIIRDISKKYELCSGNIQFLLESIDDCIINKKDVFGAFIEPNFSFELKCIDDKYIEFIIWCHDNSFNNGSYGDNAIGFRFVIRWQDLVNFEQQLKYEFNNKEKLLYKDYLEKEKKFYEED